MPVAPSFSDLLTQGKAEAQFRRPDVVFYDGDITLAQLHGAGAMADACLRFGAQAFKETFLDGAEGAALTALVDDHYNIQRQAANPAAVIVEWSRLSGGAGGTIPIGSVVATEFDPDGNSIEYTTDAATIVAAADNGPIAIACSASVPARSGNSVAGTVTRVVDQPSFDPVWTVTNPVAAAGGQDEESDEALRTRARQFFLTLRRGTLAALEFGSLQLPSVAFASATEDLATGFVTVKISDADGNSNLLMVEDVEEELENWRAAGTLVQVIGGTALAVDMGITLVVRAGFSVAARHADFVAAFDGRLDKQKPGEILYLDSVVAAIIALDPDNIFEVTFDTITVGGVPAAIQDVTPSSTQVIRAGTSTFTGAP